MTVRLIYPLGYPILYIRVQRLRNWQIWLNRHLAVGKRGWEIIIIDWALFL